jgi:hypothetical protein
MPFGSGLQLIQAPIALVLQRNNRESRSGPARGHDAGCPGSTASQPAVQMKMLYERAFADAARKTDGGCLFVTDIHRMYTRYWHSQLAK